MNTVLAKNSSFSFVHLSFLHIWSHPAFILVYSVILFGYSYTLEPIRASLHWMADF